MRYDTIVVGAGSAGAVIATRITEDPARSVLLLEAGPDYPDLASTPDDVLNGYWNSTRAHDWRFIAHHTQEGRAHAMPRGRLAGGSSAVNTQIALRGTPEDYDEWAALGNPEWSWEKLLPLFRLIENDQDFDDDYHGRSGPIPVRRYKRAELVNWQAAFLDAVSALGYPRAADNNDPYSTGAGPHPMNREGRLRISTAIAYLSGARGRSNLAIRGGAHVRRVLLANGRAAGVEVETETGGAETIFADQVVLCAGAFQSPAILTRSGIGGRDALNRLGVPLAVDLPGVGENLWDHPIAGVAFEPRPGLCQTDVPSVQVTMRYTASGSAERNDMQVMPVSFVNAPGGPKFAIGACLERPRGFGRIVVESLDPHAQPRIESHFCDDPEDLRRMVEGVRIALRVGETAAIAALHQGVFRPRPHHLESDEALGAWIRIVADSGFHPCGTARMGPAGDDGAVVDQYCRVRGVEGLLLADASIMPTIPRANLNLTVIAFGERVGAWLRDAGAPPPATGVSVATNGVREPSFAAPAQRVSPFATAVRCGANYLESRQRPDGMIGDERAAGLGGFYKAAAALTAGGRSRAASRLAGWLRTHGATPDGDFAGDWERGGLGAIHPYPNAWIVLGLQRAGGYDLARRGIDFLATLQDPNSGGLFDRPDGPRERARQTVMPSCMAGVAALACGRLDLAHGVARFLRAVLAAQPEPQYTLHHVYTRERGVVTDYPPERAESFVIDARKPRQAYFTFGIAAAFLTEYALATGDRGALDDAAAFLEPAHRATPAMYETAQVGKVAWGAALLYGAAGEPRQRTLALRAAGALLAQQNPDGSWDNTGGFSTEGVRDEVTAEFVTILDWVERGLAAVPVADLPPPAGFASLLPRAREVAR